MPEPESVFYAIWREPAEESVGLYPGLVVHDARQAGSITAGRSRLPLWALTGDLAASWDWSRLEDGYAPLHGLTSESFGLLIHDILQLRGEFGRLILVLADAERSDRVSRSLDSRWWKKRRTKAAVMRQLRSCLAALEATSA